MSQLLVVFKKAPAPGECRPHTPYHVLYFSKIKYFPHIKYSIYFIVFHECGHWTQNKLLNHVVIYSKSWFQICTNMNGLKFVFEIFLGWGTPSPLPRPLSFLLSDFALCLGSALNFFVRSALDSGFALDSQVLRTLDLSIVLHFRLGNSVGPPK